MQPQYMYVNDNKFIGRLANEMNTENGLFHGGLAIVAMVDRNPVGILSLSNNASEIISLEVLPDYRRRGIATKLLSHAKKIAKIKGRQTLRVTSMNQRSNNLYSKFGKKRSSFVFNIIL